MGERIEEYRLKYVLRFPRDVEPGVLYLERADSGAPKWAHFLCPCGCGHESSIPLEGAVSTKSRPKWEFEEKPEGRPTLSPSILRLEGCKSHFFIREGRVQWA